MMLIICEIDPQTENTNSTIAKIWINTHNLKKAETLAKQLLAQEGRKLQKIVECVKTDKDDYFPPCKSLDTFIRAEEQGIAILYV